MISRDQIRPPVAQDHAPLARLWHDGWHDAHATLIPAAILPHRTLETFAARLPPMLANIRVTGPKGAPTGFCYIEGDEVDQMYVSQSAQGTGAAAVLLADGEARLRDNGVKVAWLSCAAGNERAARFYEKHGWVSSREIVAELLATAPGWAPTGTSADVWRYSKQLR